MGVDHKKGDVVKAKINREIVNCIVISDLLTHFEIGPNDYYLDYLSNHRANGYKICLWEAEQCTFFADGFCVLIGDQKVYVEHDEIW